jgi:ATP-dependent helicase/nuclease subunit B
MPQIFHNNAYPTENLPANPGDFIKSSIESGEYGSHILVVPTGKMLRKWSNFAVKEYFESTGKPGTELPFFNLKGLVQSLYNYLFPGKGHFISDAYRLALFEEAVEKSNLDFFSNASGRIGGGVIERLCDIIYGLKEDGIEPEDLYRDVKHFEKGNYSDEIKDPLKLKDIAEIYRNYRELLGENLLDYPDALRKINGLFQSADTSKINDFFVSRKSVLFYGFTEFSPPEMQFLSMFAELSTPAAIVLDYSEQNGPLFGNMKEYGIKLKSEGFGKITVDEIPLEEELFNSSDNSGNTSYLRKWLFNTETETRKPEFKEILSIWEFADKNTEAAGIAKFVKKIIRDKFARPHEICVVSRVPEHYAALFRDSFAAHGVAVNVTDRFRLSGSPVINGIFSAINTSINGFRADDLLRTLQNPYLKIEKGGEKIEPELIQRAASKLRITGGKRLGGRKYWESRLKSSAQKIRGIITYTEDELEQMSLKRNAALFDSALAEFEFSADFLDKFSNKMLPAEFAAQITSLLDDLKVAENIAGFSENAQNSANSGLKEEAEKAARAFAEFLKVLNEMVYILTDREPGKKYNAEFLRDRLQTAAEGAKYQVRERGGFGVTVTSVEQTRGLDFKVMIFAGALDGIIPKAYKPEHFLGKEARNSEERHNRAEQIMFYQFLTNAPGLLNSGDKKIIITYPAADDDGKDMVRSPFIDSLLKITVPEEEVFTRIEQAEQFTGFYSSEAEIQKSGIQFEKSSYPSFDKNDEVRLDKELFSDNSIAALQNFYNKTYSISELETYAKCPFKHFASRVLQLEEKEDIGALMTPLEKGSLLHKIAYEFYSQVGKSGQTVPMALPGQPVADNLPKITPIRLDPGQKTYYMQLVHGIASAEINSTDFGQPLFELEREWLLGSDDNPGIAELWLHDEISRFESGWDFTPALFEFPVGLPLPGGGKIPPAEIGGVKIRGKIDRVEFDEDDGNFGIVATDYKIGMKASGSLSQIRDGVSFQIPVYLLALQNILEEYYGIEAEILGGIYIGFDKKENKSSEKFVLIPKNREMNFKVNGKAKSNFVENEIELESILNDVANIIGEKVNEIGRGRFDAAPYKNECRYCSYKPVCRINKRAVRFV